MRGDRVAHTEWLDDLVAELRRRHPRFRQVTIERLVSRIVQRYDDAPVKAFVPVLVRREALEQLRYAEGIVPAGAQPAHHDAALLSV